MTTLILSLVLISILCAIAAVVADVRASRAVAVRLLTWAFYLENIRREKRDWADRSHHYRLKLRMAYDLDEAKHLEVSTNEHRG